MRDAEAVLQELIRHVRPPRGCAIVFTEWTPNAKEPNWTASCGNMESSRLSRQTRPTTKVRPTDRLVKRQDFCRRGTAPDRSLAF